MKKSFILLMSVAVGIMAANLYYAQPILAQIAHYLGMRPDAAGLVMTLTQVGYGLGVLLIVPLGDLVENKKLILTMIITTVFAEILLGSSSSLMPYMFASILVGIGASAVQIIVPYTTHLFDKSERGTILGTLMSGLMIGIMLSRPLSSLMTDFISMHAIFYFSAVIMFFLACFLYKILPERKPEATTLKYNQLIWSMKDLLLNTPILRRRAIYQACMFGAFCLFWTVVPFELVSTFHFSQKGVALFAFAGLAGAAAAPLAGKFADKGLSKQATTLSFGIAIFSFVLSQFIRTDGFFAVVLLIIAANLLDAGVSMHLVLGQRAVFMIDPKNQSRLNGLYLAIIYIGGAIGSALGGWSFQHGGWEKAMIAGLVFPLIAFTLFLSERAFKYQEAY